MSQEDQQKSKTDPAVNGSDSEALESKLQEAKNKVDSEAAEAAGKTLNESLQDLGKDGGVDDPKSPEVDNPTKPEKPAMAEEPKSFKAMLEAKEIKAGDEIGFKPNQSDKEVVITVDEAWLDLPVHEEEYYAAHSYCKK